MPIGLYCSNDGPQALLATLVLSCDTSLVTPLPHLSPVSGRGRCSSCHRAVKLKGTGSRSATLITFSDRGRRCHRIEGSDLSAPQNAETDQEL